MLTDEQHKRRVKASAAGGIATAAKHARGPVGDDKLDVIADWTIKGQKAKASAQISKARLLEIEVKKATGELIPVADARRQMAVQCALVRRACAAAPTLVDAFGLPPDQAANMRTLATRLAHQIIAGLAKDLIDAQTAEAKADAAQPSGRDPGMPGVPIVSGQQ